MQKHPPTNRAPTDRRTHLKHVEGVEGLLHQQRAQGGHGDVLYVSPVQHAAYCRVRPQGQIPLSVPADRPQLTPQNATCCVEVPLKASQESTNESPRCGEARRGLEEHHCKMKRPHRCKLKGWVGLEDQGRELKDHGEKALCGSEMGSHVILGLSV